ncbi:hypothetical protein [Emcibacter sp.]|uniref:hypothetical protein n=1 Tax=Emcibacter sp. TaxID=1979954 RepID=UPI003A8DFDDE
MTSSKSARILLISRDPGGTNQLVALRQLLLSGQGGKFGIPDSDDVPELFIAAKEFAQAIWRNAGQDIIALEQDLGEDRIRELLNRIQPDFIYTGTSHIDDRTEQEVWRVASQMGIPTAALVDSQNSILLRFTDNRNVIVTPDRIFVVDARSKQELTDAGVKKAHITVGGDLYRTHLGTVENLAGQAGETRAHWQVEEGESVILFASDYISEIGLDKFPHKVSEFDCLEYLLEALRGGNSFEGLKAPFRLVIRPHPKDTPGKYDNYPEQSQNGLAIIVTDQGSSLEAVGAADIVVGMNSSLFREAEVLGVPVVPLIPLVQQD